ncbi:restriction endonuclease subunit S [Bacteroidales bacterium SW299]|nr:restriction endonuclease subunit S [Bacteroidales bacterium SW299]
MTMADNADNKDKKVLNVPALRFPEFTEEWESVLLEDVAEFQKKRISSDLLNNSNYISTENILQNFGGVQNSISIPANTNVIEYQRGDVLLSNIRPYLKKVWLSDRHGGCSADVFVLRGNQCERRFLYYVIASDRFINFVMSGAKGVKMPRGDKSQMEKFTFFIPTNVEQKKIAMFLSMLDERIRLQNKIIEKLETLIKGIRNNIISKIKGDCITLQDIADIYQPQTIASTDLTEDGYLVYGANGIIGKYRSFNHEKEQICITCRGNTCGTVNFTEPKSWITGNAMVINTDNYAKNVNKRYLFHYLSSINFNSIISGSGQPQIVRQPLAKLKLILPVLIIQNRIAECLDAMFAKMKNEQSFLQILQIQKSCLLSQMFI